MDGLISIIVPVYNVGKYVGKCIESLCGQSLRDIEIILVDDGSTDNSPGLCDFYGRRDARVKVIHKGNGGLVSARKAGLEAATGEYIGYVDGDDWVEKGYYETMLRYMVQYQADMVETEHYMDAGAESRRVKSRLPYGRYSTEELIPVMLCDRDFNECRMQPYLWSKLFKRRLLEKHQMGADSTIQCGEDMAVVYPYILEAGSVYIAEYAGCHYVQRRDSMTGIGSMGSREADRALIRYLKQAFEADAGHSGVMLGQLNQYAKSMLLRQVSFFDRFPGGKKLMPFGGLEEGQRAAVYGAGRMGKSVYRYLETESSNGVVMWGDREYALYRQLGMPVVPPEEIVGNQEKYDKLFIAVSSRKLARNIQDSLAGSGMDRGKMAWLTEEFISGSYDVLHPLLETGCG